MVGWTSLCNLHVPENRRVKLEDVTDVLSECGRLKPLSPRHVRHFAESQLLDFVGEQFPSCLIGSTDPVGNELLQLRASTVASAEIGLLGSGGRLDNL